MNIITPAIRPVISFLEPYQLPGEYTAHAAKCVPQRASSNTITISALTGPHDLYSWVKEKNL